MSQNKPHLSGTTSCVTARGKFPLVLLLLIGLFISCGRQTGELSHVDVRLSWLGTMYGMFVGQHRGRTPKNADEFRLFVEKTADSEQLERLQVADVSELFTSPRDGKPFKMVTYSKLPPPVGGEPAPVVLYEEVGQDGKRAVGFLGGGTQWLDETTLQTMLPAAAAR